MKAQIGKLLLAAIAAISVPSIGWSTGSPCDLDWSAVQGLRVDVEDSENCGGSNGSTQNPSVGAALKGGVDCGEYILAITVQGVVEDEDAGYDFVYVNGVNFFSSRGSGADCDMLSTSETRQITVKAKDTITLSYDTGDHRFHRGAYAQITNIALVQAPAGCNGGCSGGTCSSAPGGGTASNSSVDVRVSLGEAVRGLYPGMFHIKTKLPDAAIYTPDGINFGFDIDLNNEVIRSGTALRQVLTEQVLADIVTISAYKYEIRFYYAADAGAKTGGVYVPTASPYRTWSVEDPDSGTGSNHRVRVTESPGGTPVVHDYTWIPANQNWTLVSANLKEIGRKSETVGAQRSETYWLKNVGGAEAFRQITTFTTYAWGEEKVSEVLDPNHSSGGQVTAWTYYDNALSDGVNYGRLKLLTTPTGYWERYEYDTAGRVVKVVSPVGDASPAAAESACRVVTTIFSTSWPQETRVENVLGQEVERRYTIFSGALTREILAATPGATYNDSANLVTETVRVDGGEFDGEVKSIKRPDGTMTIYSYSRNSVNGEKTLVTEVGQPDSGGTSIVDGTRTTLVEDAFGNFLSEDVKAIANDLLLGSKSRTDSDSFGRPLRIDYLDGTAEEFSFACCGLDNQTDRFGVVTSYTYDGLKRTKTETRLGVTKEYIYDAADRVVQVTRIGSDSTAIITSKTQYDLAGREAWTEDARERRTSFDYGVASGGGEVRTTTREADGATEVRTYHRDGQVYTIAGTSLAPRKWIYGVASGGLRWTQEIAVGEAGAETEWVKSWENPLGQLVKKEYPDSAEEAYFYDLQGRLDRQTDPDGVQTLYGYNTLGERTVTVLDIDGIGQINYGGLDRITRQTRVYTTRVEGSNTFPVERITTEVWENDSSVTPTTISVAESTFGGLHSWQTSFGLTTTTVRSVDTVTGQHTDTITLPDGTSSVRVSFGDRMLRETRRDDTGAAIAETLYGYDAHGRLHVVSSLQAPGSTLPAAGSPLVTTTTYYADDQPYTVTTPDPDTSRSGPGYDSQTTTYTYNSAGWVEAVTQPDLTQTSTTYWPTGRVKRTWGSRTYPSEYTYDPQGRVKTLTTWQDFSTASGAAITTWNYSPVRGWLTSKRYNDNTGPDYDYWPSARLKTRDWARSVSSTRLRTNYVYNNAGDLWTVDYADATPDVTNTYDRLGRLKTTTDAAGVVTRSYQNGRLDDETYENGSAHLSGFAVNRTQGTYNRPASLGATSITSVDYGYDNAGRIATFTQGARVATLAYKPWIGTHQSTGITVSGTPRYATNRNMDALGRISRVETGSGALPIASIALLASRDYSYNSANQRTEVVQEDALRWAYGYDTLGQVTSAQKRNGNSAADLLPGYDHAYAYDTIGNRVNTETNGRLALYSPDLRNQYVSRTVPGAVDVLGSAATDVNVLVDGALPARTGELFYRAVSVSNAASPVFKSVEVIGARPGASPASDQVTTETRSAFVAQTAEVYAYDLDGNLTQDGRWNYVWDAENRLIEQATRDDVASAAAGLTRQKLVFGYDTQSRRVRKQVFGWTGSAWATTPSSDLRFLYDGWNLLAEYNALSTNAVVRTHVWGLDLSGSAQGAGGVAGLLWTSTTTNTYAPGWDGNGNIVAWIDLSNGTVSGRRDYGPFGEPLSATGNGATLPFAFSTKYRDSETELYYYGFRYYSSGTGRWLGRDPIEENGGMNLNGFLNNDGVNLYDILGLAWTLKSIDSISWSSTGSSIVGLDSLPSGSGMVVLNGTGTNGNAMIEITYAGDASVTCECSKTKTTKKAKGMITYKATGALTTLELPKAFQVGRVASLLSMIQKAVSGVRGSGEWAKISEQVIGYEKSLKPAPNAQVGEWTAGKNPCAP